jgi:hypothetical protein
MKRGIFGLMVLCLAFGFVLVGCPDPNKVTPVTIEWQKGTDGFIQYSTNDPKKYAYAFWNSYVNSSGDVNVYEIECKKISGYSNIGYGMIFGFVDNNNYYSLIITNTGYYQIGKRVKGTTTVVQAWLTSTHLNTGSNVLNTLKAVYSPTDKRYTVYLNGNNVAMFNEDANVTGGTKIGFYASVSSQANENFPDTPVDIRFRQK